MLKLDFINVGYGDALLVRDEAAGFSMLVDCGSSSVVEAEKRHRVTAAEFLRKEKIHVLDLVVLTHLHLDHCGGLKEISDVAEIRRIWTNFLPPHQFWGGKTPAIIRQKVSGNRDLAGMLTEAMDCVLYALGEQNPANVLELCRSMPEIQLTPDLSVEVSVAPSDQLTRQKDIWEQVFAGKGTDLLLEELDGFINHTSARLRLSYCGKNVELPGDLNAAELERLEPGQCQILKLGHHGHRDGMSLTLLERLNPAAVVISVAIVQGDVCPDQQILDWLRQRGCAVHITDDLSGMDWQRGSVRLTLENQRS